ncbi:MAG: RluA family pseudouridine synthase [Myxococcales bacterium]|nr:RluA family pseudouridine synthase [Myxococcales bacterium]
MKNKPESSATLVDGRFSVPEQADGLCLDRLLRDSQPGSAWSRVRRAIETGKVNVDGERVTDPTRKLRAGQTVVLTLSARSATPASSTAPTIVHLDRDLVVVDKPPLVSTVPFDHNERDTLVDRVRHELSRRERRPLPPLGVVQRLDKETSGLVVFARTLVAKRHLKQQLRFHTVHRRYEALVHGVVSDQIFRSRLVEDRGDGLRGSTDNPRLGQSAVTHVRLLSAFTGAAHLECRLETGRTHQIRIHLSEASHPLIGERVYVRGFAGPLIEAPRLMLHARELGFVHPATDEPVHFSAELPDDFRALLARLENL